MGRLIDADHLLFLLNSAIELRKKLHRHTSDLDMIVDAVNNEPTAYAPDRVVEQLEKKIQTHKNCIEYEKKNGTVTEEFQQRKAVEVLEGAIVIVKKGGINDNSN